MNLGIDLSGKNNVTWNEVEEALNLLANNEVNEVSLSEDDGWESVVTSGENGLVALSYFNNHNDMEATLINRDAKGMEYNMKIGRQIVPMADKIIVPIEQAIEVFRAFYHRKNIFDLKDIEWMT